MPIVTTCPSCSAVFNLPEELAGQQVRCQRCAHTFVVPLPESPISEPTVAEEPPTAAVPESPPKPIPPRPGSSVAGLLVLVALFLFALVGASAFAVVWTIVHLGPAPQISSAPLPRPLVEVRNDDERKPRDAKDRVKDKKVGLPPVVPAQIFVGPDGRVNMNGRIDQPLGFDHLRWNNEGPYRLLKMPLQQDKTYNFHVASNDFTPRIRIFDGEKLAAERVGVGPFNAWRVMLSFRPPRTGEYLIHINSLERFPVGFFFMNIAPEIRPGPISADLTVKATYTHFGQLRIEDPLDASAKNHGPYCEYDVTLDADKDYSMAVSCQLNVTPILQIHEDKRVIETIGERKFEFNDFRVATSYRPPVTGKYRIRVTSKDFALGTYTLTINTKAVAVQTILASLDGTGVYTDQRALSPSDPKLGVRGHYKAYLVTLEQGKKYRIEMTQKESATSLLLFDPAEQKVGDQTNAPLMFTAQRSGVHRLHVVAPLPKARESYSLRIAIEP